MDYPSGNSSPASSVYGADAPYSSENYHRLLGPSDRIDPWYRSSSPANGSGLMLPSSHRSSSSSSAILEGRVQQLETENSILRAQRETMNAAYHELVNAVPTLLMATSNPFNLPVPDQASLTHIGTIRPSLPPLSKTDYEKVRYWHRLDFSKKNGSDGVSNNGGPNPRGGTLISQGINTTGRYIEDENGKTIDGLRLGAIYKLAAAIWFGLVKSGKAPRTWGQASLDVTTLYNDEMCRQFPELHLCADNWKAQQVATQNYPSWYKTHGVANDDSKPSGSGSGSKHRNSSPLPAQEMRKKIKLDTVELLPFDPLWQPPPAPGVLSVLPGGIEEIPGPVTPGSVPISVTPSSVPSAAASAPALAHPESIAVDDAVIDDSSAVNSTAVYDPVALNSVNVQLASAPVPFLAETPASIIPTPTPTPTTMNTAAAAAHADLIASAFPPPLPAPVISTPVPVVAAPPAAKAGGKMTLTDSLTARNLCAREWVTKHPGGLRVTFAEYWTSIANTDEEKRWIKESKDAKAVVKKNTALAIA
ncbi:hypothetical protein FB451DRAFT_1484655 [Mycena latifolia]|nr:hypothetical protein FB451DRAFT_1484655 [Mycena latifolia]